MLTLKKKLSNQQPRFTNYGVTKRRETKPKASRRNDIIKMKAVMRDNRKKRK